MLLWCGSDNLTDEWLASHQECLAEDIDLETRTRRHAGQNRRSFVGWHNVEVFDILPQRRVEMFVAVLLWWEYYKGSR